MQVQIVLFGQLTDITGSHTLVLNGVADTNQVVAAVNKLFPAMADVKYIIAVDKKQVQENTALNETASVALLPPFSGG